MQHQVRTDRSGHVGTKMWTLASRRRRRLQRPPPQLGTVAFLRRGFMILAVAVRIAGSL